MSRNVGGQDYGREDMGPFGWPSFAHTPPVAAAPSSFLVGDPADETTHEPAPAREPAPAFKWGVFGVEPGAIKHGFLRGRVQGRS